MNEPARPTAIVCGIVIGSLPGQREPGEGADDQALEGEDDDEGDQAHGASLPARRPHTREPVR